MSFIITLINYLTLNTLIEVLVMIDLLIGLAGGIILIYDWKTCGFHFKWTQIPFCIFFPLAIIILLLVLIDKIIDNLISFIQDLLT